MDVCEGAGCIAGADADTGKKPRALDGVALTGGALDERVFGEDAATAVSMGWGTEGVVTLLEPLDGTEGNCAEGTALS